MIASTRQWLTRHLFDVRIDAATMEQVLEAVDHAVSQRRRLLISVINAAKIVNMDRDQGLRRAVLAADLILADGMSIVWACRLLRMALPQRVAGIDLMNRMLRQGGQRGYRVYLLGAKKSVLECARDRIERECPGIIVVGARNGYFSIDEEEGIAHAIADAKPDILFVGMSSPRKERFVAQWSRLMNVPVLHGVGGSFDVWAGKVRRAPILMQRLGLEWAYRAAQEPRRLLLRYVETNTMFLVRLAVEGLRRVVLAVLPIERIRADRQAQAFSILNG